MRVENEYHHDSWHGITFDFSDPMEEDPRKFAVPEGLVCHPAKEEIKVNIATIDKKAKLSLVDFFMKKLKMK